MSKEKMDEGLGAILAANGLRMFGDKLYPDERTTKEIAAENTLANSLGGVAMHGKDYIDMGNLNFNSDGHAGDSGKLPWHPTFSNESTFASNNPNGTIPLGVAGYWKSNPMPGPRNDVYYPDREQITNNPRYLEELQRYYTHEKGKGIDKVVLPVPYRDDLIK